MAQTMPVRIGADASCTDGACGQVSRVIVNPAAREVTHLVVDPKHRNDLGRLVPADLMETTTGQIRLRCKLAEFQALRAAEQTDSVPDLDPTGHTHQEVRKQYRLGVGVVWPVRYPGLIIKGFKLSPITATRQNGPPDIMRRAVFIDPATSFVTNGPPAGSNA